MDLKRADCHLHFEGCLPIEFLEKLGRRAGHPFGDRAVFEEARRSFHDAPGFLDLYAEVCKLFRRPEDYREAARAVAASLASDGVVYAEVYVSPEIFARIGLPPAACLEAAVEGFREEEKETGRVRVLLDAVRHWGPEAAERVLDLYEKSPHASVVGFGLGGDESAVPASAFAGVYARARALGLKTSVHAGEWAGPDSVREALDALRPDRVDHGIAAAADPELLARLASDRTILWVAPSGNAATGAVARIEEHPLPRLLAAGVRVALCADDPLFFATTTGKEYRIAEEKLGLSEEQLREIGTNAWQGTFLSPPAQSAREARGPLSP